MYIFTTHSHFASCGSKKYPSYPYHRGVIGNSEGGGGLEGQNFKGMYEPKLEFPEGWGVQTKKAPLWGEYGYFLQQHKSTLLYFLKLDS